MLDIAGAEQAGREADERRQHHQIDVEVVDEDQRRRVGSVHEEHWCRRQRDAGGERVQSRGEHMAWHRRPAAPPEGHARMMRTG